MLYALNMIRNLTAIIDALGDRVHPIAVLLLRKQQLWRGWLPVTLGTHVILLFIVCGGEQLARTWPEAALFGEIYLHLLLWFPFMASTTATIHSYSVQKSDPLLLSTPLSDRSVWLGFYLTGLFQGFGAWCYVVLTYSYCYTLRWVSLEYVLLYPLLSLLTGYFVTALVMPIAAAARTGVHRCFVVPVCFLPLWSFLMLPMQPAPIRSRMLAPFFHAFPPSLFEPVCWVPVLILAIPAYLWAAWKLFHFNLSRRRPFFVKYCVSLFVYLMLTAALAGLWFGLCFLVY